MGFSAPCSRVWPVPGLAGLSIILHRTLGLLSSATLTCRVFSSMPFFAQELSKIRHHLFCADDVQVARVRVPHIGNSRTEPPQVGSTVNSLLRPPPHPLDRSLPAIPALVVAAYPIQRLDFAAHSPVLLQKPADAEICSRTPIFPVQMDSTA